MGANEARGIRDEAEGLGFAGCGILPIEDLGEYEQKLDDRMRRCPCSSPLLGGLKRLADPRAAHPWARSAIVCVTDYSRFRVPDPLLGRIGRYYLFDHVLQPAAPGSARIAAFEQMLDARGIRWAKEPNGAVPARMAAEKAGLGIVRRSNFLFTASGSRTILDAWLIDRPLEWRESPSLPPCPDGCRLCVEACPTRALSGPHCMDAFSCVTWLTWGSRSLPGPEASRACGSWLYGCDVCQDACPHNAGLRAGRDGFDGLDELAETLSLPSLLSMDDAAMKERLLPRFRFIQPDRFWLWKVNALRVMANERRPEYAAAIERARGDSSEKVREMAERAAAGLRGG